MVSDDVIIHAENGRVVATLLLRRVTGGPEEEKLWTAIDSAVVQAAARAVTLDCRHVQYLSSLAIGHLVAFAKRCRASGARLVVRDLCPTLEQVFRLMRLETLMEIAHEDRAGKDDTP